jgi:NAD(P)-dependent dehydrogenase (short-subunit alcohol dehydrogenase family)
MSEASATKPSGVMVVTGASRSIGAAVARLGAAGIRDILRAPEWMGTAHAAGATGCTALSRRRFVFRAVSRS